MRKIALMLMAVMVGGLMTGCMGTPNWVKEGSGVHKAKWNVGIYGVGQGAAEVSPEVQSDLASINARAATDEAGQKYVAGLLEGFVEAHPEWFNTQRVQQLDLYAKAAEDVMNKTMYLTEKVSEWSDEKGSAGEAGTMYLLRRIPLNQQFFDAVHESFRSIIQQNKDSILRVEADEVLAGLEKAIMGRVEKPLGSAMAISEKKTEEAAPAAEEAMEEAPEQTQK